MISGFRSHPQSIHFIPHHLYTSGPIISQALDGSDLAKARELLLAELPSLKVSRRRTSIGRDFADSAGLLVPPPPCIGFPKSAGFLGSSLVMMKGRGRERFIANKKEASQLVCGTNSYSEKHRIPRLFSFSLFFVLFGLRVPVFDCPKVTQGLILPKEKPLG